jgi:hypothetical protein
VAHIRDAARRICTIARPSRNHPKIQTRATTNPQHLWLGGNQCILRTSPLSSSSGPYCCSAHVCLNTSSRNSTRDGPSQPQAIFRMTCDRRRDKAGSGLRKQKATVAGLMSRNSWARGLHNNQYIYYFSVSILRSSGRDAVKGKQSGPFEATLSSESYECLRGIGI